MRDYKETLEWYRTHETAKEIGFDPDGMCLKVCRTARAIGSMYPTAKKAQDATPKEHRVYKVADLRKGMILYFDDPNDSNTAGHIVTMIGRVRGGDPNDLDDVLVRTNSVKDNALVVVRASYFKKYWNDTFQFGATWLNGQVLDYYKKQKPKTFDETGPNWDTNLLGKNVQEKIKQEVESLPDDEGDSRVNAFKEHYEKTGILKMPLLNEAISEGRKGKTLEVRNNLRSLIKSVLPR